MEPRRGLSYWVSTTLIFNESEGGKKCLVKFVIFFDFFLSFFLE